MIKNLGHKKLSKTGSHRRAMFANMATSLLLHEKIKTTLPKAMELRRVVEGIVNDAKLGRKLEVRKAVKSREVYNKLFDVLAPRYKERAGGCTRILRLGMRRGDAAEVALVKLAD
ncbi:MAG: 50S ribosomal protein L17 [Elusimicrobia bacterium RIFOXYB2_FULL_62_6]|nr:MAG: 50S ribosomal protein L17 [Elusimicrobia bacterium RIFOXYB2_FULL_62_6]